jgi:hypothetical protein
LGVFQPQNRYSSNNLGAAEQLQIEWIILRGTHCSEEMTEWPALQKRESAARVNVRDYLALRHMQTSVSKRVVSLGYICVAAKAVMAPGHEGLNAYLDYDYMCDGHPCDFDGITRLLRAM